MELKHRGRQITSDDVEFIRKLIADNPSLSRRQLSYKLCEAWNWYQSNGAMRDMVCRGLMLYLHRAGQIELPAVRFKTRNPLAEHPRPDPLPLQGLEQSPAEGPLKQWQPLDFRMVRRTPEEALFNSLVAQFHYLGYTQPVGEHLKYIVYAKGRPLGCLAWSSAPRHLGPRDGFIGWDPQQRRNNIRFVAYNLRFLLLPWVHIPNAASHILGRMARIVPEDWEKLYHHRVYLLETFIDPERFRGSCYRAANWIYLGLTTGRGKDDQTKKQNRPLKQLWVYPLTRDFREKLRQAEP